MALAEAAAVVSEALTFPDQARTLVITDQESYDKACLFVKGVKALRTKVEDTFRPHIRRATEAHTALLKEMREADAPLAEAEKLAKAALATFDERCAELARQEQQRQLAEVRAREEERRLQQAVELESRGQSQAAEAMLSKPLIVPAPPPSEPVKRKGSGVSFGTAPLSGNVVDLQALVAFVAANPVFTNLVRPNDVAINAQIRAMGRECVIPGVEVVGGGRSVSVSSK